MDESNPLSPAKCIILAAALASSSNLSALSELVSSHSDLLNVELTCRILLTYLPETLDPSKYVSFLLEAADAGFEAPYQDVLLDTSSVDQLSDVEAQTQLKKLRLLHLKHPSIPDGAADDALTLFLIHRAHRIDSDTGLLPLVPQLITPFLDRSQYLRDWYVGAVVPFLRSEYEYFPADYSSLSLRSFEELDGSSGVQTLLSKTEQHDADGQATSDTVGRDLRGILGPWILAGQALRGKKRKRGSDDGIEQTHQASTDERRGKTRMALTASEWQTANQWLVSKASENFPLAVSAFEGWRGPMDVDLGVAEDFYEGYQPDQQETEELQKDYCQAAFAAIYATEQDSPETIDGAHTLLVRLSELMGFEPPPDLATSVHMLPKIERNTNDLETTLMMYIQSDALLHADNPLTRPSLETFSLTQMLMYSAYLLASIGNPLSVLKIAKLRFWSEEDEQLRLIQRIMRGLMNGQKKDESQWRNVRDVMRWLWDWAIDTETDVPHRGFGVFGKVKKSDLEIELLKASCTAGHYEFVTQTYLENDHAQNPLAKDEVEKVIVSLALHYYDNASNGNRTRGGVKKASDIIAAFRSHFPGSRYFARCGHLISATHALSFYSLTLRRGVPFQPVSIRESEDPVDLVEKVLQQNPNSYTKLDDLIDIGRNLVRASTNAEQIKSVIGVKASDEDESSQLLTAERRVISMAIESALQSGDFETAYSYVVNRLSPSPFESGSPTSHITMIDDISWRAALRAGRHRLLTSTQTSTNNTATSPQVRGLEQRMELLSHSLQLAPPPHLPEVLAAWRQVEEELLALLEQESKAEQEFDDKADRGELRHVIPGSFGQQSDMGGPDDLTLQPRRKELGRGAAEEAPMGLFEVARSAAAAIGKSTSGSLGPGKLGSRDVSGATIGEDAEGRQRKRDMVANAVTGGLASGIGWVLGARPVQPEQSS